MSRNEGLPHGEVTGCCCAGRLAGETESSFGNDGSVCERALLNCSSGPSRERFGLRDTGMNHDDGDVSEVGDLRGCAIGRANLRVKGADSAICAVTRRLDCHEVSLAVRIDAAAGRN